MAVPPTEQAFAPKLQNGQAVEVYWMIVRNEGLADEETVNLWWRAQAETRSHQPDGDGASDQQCILHYQARDEFDAEQSCVTILTDRLLRDETTSEVMAWRCVGDEWCEPEAALDAYETVSLQDIQQQSADELRESMGIHSEEEAMAQLQAEVPREKLIEGALGLNAFAEQLRAYLRDLTQQHEQQQHGEPFVVTKAHIDSFVQQLHANSA